LALREGTEPIRREQPCDLPLELLLLEIQASLAPLDPGEQIADGHAQRPFDRAPLVRPLDLAGRGAELFELVDERLAQDRQALAREHLLFEEELDDARRQTGERKLAGTRDAGTIDAHEHPLLAKPPNRVVGPRAQVLRPRLGEAARLFEGIEQLRLRERGETPRHAAQVEVRQEAQIGRAEVERDASLGEGSDAVGVGQSVPRATRRRDPARHAAQSTRARPGPRNSTGIRAWRRFSAGAPRATGARSEADLVQTELECLEVVAIATLDELARALGHRHTRPHDVREEILALA